MNNQQSQVTPESVGRTSQIIAMSFIIGLVTLMVVTGSIRKDPPKDDSLLALLAAVVAGTNLIARLIVPTIIVNRAKAGLKDASDADLMKQLAALYQTKMIVGMAVLEGAAFFNLVAYFLERHIWSYGVVAFLVGVMAISFPSQGQFESWAEEMKRELN